MMLEDWQMTMQSMLQIKRYFRKEKDLLLNLGYEFISSDTNTQNVFDPPIIHFREPIITNSRWNFASAIRRGQTLRGVISIENKEVVVVPAGHFETIKVVGRSNLGEVIEWYAKGIGLVKRIEVQEVKGLGEQTTRYELVSYSGTTGSKLKETSLLDKLEREWNWIYTDNETGVRFAQKQYSGWVVIGEVPGHIDLTNHETAKKLLTRGKDVWLYMTQKTRKFESISTKKIEVNLYVDSYTEKSQEEDVSGCFSGNYDYKPLQGSRRMLGGTGWYDRWGYQGGYYSGQTPGGTSRPEYVIREGTATVIGFDTLEDYRNRVAERARIRAKEAEAKALTEAKLRVKAEALAKHEAEVEFKAKRENKVKAIFFWPFKKVTEYILLILEVIATIVLIVLGLILAFGFLLALIPFFIIGGGVHLLQHGYPAIGILLLVIGVGVLAAGGVLGATGEEHISGWFRRD